MPCPSLCVPLARWQKQGGRERSENQNTVSQSQLGVSAHTNINDYRFPWCTAAPCKEGEKVRGDSSLQQGHQLDALDTVETMTMYSVELSKARIADTALSPCPGQSGF